jgi:hypothetical protein
MPKRGRQKAPTERPAPIQRPPWGRVFIVRGRWKGRMGYYDDDDEGGYCIVYPDRVKGYVLLRPTSIMEAPESEDTIH